MFVKCIMENLAINTLGYTAAVATNASIYPQAYEVYIIIKSNQCDKLKSISLSMYILQTTGCLLWLTYACIMDLHPIIFGSILSAVPSIYIIYGIVIYRPYRIIEENDAQIKDTSEIIVATSSNYVIEISPKTDDY